MKLIKAIIRPEKLNAVLTALFQADIHGLTVSRVPGYSPYAVAEHAVALILALNRQLVQTTVDMRNGIWDASRYRPCYQIINH